MNKINAIRIQAGSRLLQDSCSCCGASFQEGEYAVMIPIGPGDDPEERRKAREGRPYNALAIPAHAACVLGMETNTEDPNEPESTTAAADNRPTA